MHAGAALKALVGYCLAGRSPPPQAYAELEAVPRLDDDAYTINALRWYRMVTEERSCPDLARERVAAGVSARTGLDVGPGTRGARWVLHDEAARLLAAAGREGDAAQHLLQALAHAPTSRRDEMRRRLQRY